MLTPAEENEIVISCQVLQELGLGLTKETVGAMLLTTAAELAVATPFMPNQVLIGEEAFNHGIPHLFAGSLSTCQNIGQLLATRLLLKVSSQKSLPC